MRSGEQSEAFDGEASNTTMVSGASSPYQPTTEPVLPRSVFRSVSWNTHYLTSQLGILKIIEASLVPWMNPPLPVVLEDGTAYTIKEILLSRRRGGQLEYLVDWEGFRPEERSWVPRKGFLDPGFLSEFHEVHP